VSDIVHLFIAPMPDNKKKYHIEIMYDGKVLHKADSFKSEKAAEEYGETWIAWQKEGVRNTENGLVTSALPNNITNKRLEDPLNRDFAQLRAYGRKA
jgi:hypothetical protein